MTRITRPVGRPRDGTLDTAVLRATQDLLLEQGFDRLSLEAVAVRAGVGKAAIYRRWTGKTELVVAAVADLTRVPDIPDTGDLREDLLASARAYIQNERTHSVLAGVMTAMVHSDELRSAARRAIGDPFTELFTTIVMREADTGDIDRDVAAFVGQVFPALAFHRSAALGLAVDEEFIVRVIDWIVLPLLIRR